MITFHKTIRFKRKKNRTMKNRSNEIPIVVICWNNYYFVNNFVNQLKRFPNPIILLDNNSNYQPLLDYYKKIKAELKDKIEIRLLKKNYGHTVYKQFKHTLPDIYILSDPDLELNIKMPKNFANQLLKLSNHYKCYKVGCALNIEDKDKFIQCVTYYHGKNIYDWEKQFWEKPIRNNKYTLYQAAIDTTLSLINNNYITNNNNIRVAGNFTAKHLPWYNNYIKNNISSEELTHWKKNNKSSSILFDCLKL
jgi:hypothetical protein